MIDPDEPDAIIEIILAADADLSYVARVIACDWWGLEREPLLFELARLRGEL